MLFSQVVDLHATKRYVALFEQPGVTVTLAEAIPESETPGLVGSSTGPDLFAGA